VGLLGGWAALRAHEAEWARARCPCEPGDAPRWDRWVVGAEAGTEPAADLAAAATLGFTLVLLGPVSGQRHAEDALLVAESAALAGLLTQAAKSATSRPYPYMLERDSDPARDPDGVNYGAMWSGHTAVPMAAAVSFASIVQRRRPRAAVWAWIVGPALALSAGVLQVAAGNHYPSDVVAGAAVGAAVGGLNTWLR
jgi:undecaprenyl-diphosphatase